MTWPTATVRPMRVLVCDDEELMGDLVRQALTEEGHDVTLVTSGERAIDATRRDVFDLVVLDINLPGLDGFQTCRRLRAHGIGTPVLMLTARGDVDDRVTGLDAGADDYLAKPFSLAELLARVRALLRRGPAEFGATVAVGDLQLDTSTGYATRAGRRIELGPRERAVLELLMREPGKVITRERIYNCAWPDAHATQSNVVDALLMRLRTKIDRPFDTEMIQTVRGSGYRLDPT